MDLLRNAEFGVEGFLGLFGLDKLESDIPESAIAYVKSRNEAKQSQKIHTPKIDLFRGCHQRLDGHPKVP